MIKRRLNRITMIPPEYLSVTPPVPKSVKIELTQKCNYKCAYCAYSFRKDAPKDIDFNLFKRITKEMRDLGVEEIGVFYIGESFMNPILLIDCIYYLKKVLGIPYVFLTSNASLSNGFFVKQCMEAGLDSLKWSCNAADDEQFEQMMGVPARFFTRAKDNIKTAWFARNNNNLKTKLYASSIKYDDNQPQRAKKFLEECVLPYVDDHYWLPLYTMGGVNIDKTKELGLQPLAETQAGAITLSHRYHVGHYSQQVMC